MPRGRPRAFDPDTALERVLPVFWRDGFEGASVHDLAAAVGVSKPSLYAAYGNKEALYLSALQRYAQRSGERHSAALNAEPQVKEAMRRFLYAMVDDFTDPGSPGGCMVVSGTTTCDSSAVPESVKAALCSALRTGQTAIADRLTRAQSDGQLPAGADVEALASYFNTVISGLGVQAKGGAGSETLRRVVDAAVLVLPG